MMIHARSIFVSLCVALTGTLAQGYTWTQGEIETNKIDILFVFDASASAWLPGSAYTNAATFASAAISLMNEALANTDLDKHFTFRLAGTKDIGHNFSGANPVEIMEVVAKSVPVAKPLAKIYKEIWAERNKAKADVVAILVDGFRPGMYGNSASLNAGDLTPRRLEALKETAYCVCDISSVFSRYTLLHEMGHILGAGHSNEKWIVRPGPQARPYASGVHLTVGSNNYATVMASMHCSSNGMSWTRMPVFSSPNHTLKVRDPATGNLVDTGVPLGSPNTNDNTRMLLETYKYVANFRVARKMDNIPVNPDSIRLSVVTNGVEMPLDGTVYMHTLLSHDLKVKACATTEPLVRVKGLPRGLYFSHYTGRIMGWPEETGAFTVQVDANNKDGYRAEMEFEIVVKPGQRTRQKGGSFTILRNAKRWRRPWHRPQGAYYVLEKPLSVRLTAQSAEDSGLAGDDSLELSLMGRDGAGWVSGTVAGEKISRYVQFERFGARQGTAEGQERVGCFISEPPREGTDFKGYMRWVDLLVTVDADWHIKDMSVSSVQSVQESRRRKELSR